MSNSPIFSVGNVASEDQEGPAGDVERDAGQGLVHGQVDVGVAGDALLVAERLQKAWPSAMPVSSVGVMLVDMQVARDLHGQVEQAVAREELEHVVEEADAGARSRPVPVPSRAIDTATSVSAVRRLTLAARMRVHPSCVETAAFLTKVSGETPPALDFCRMDA